MNNASYINSLIDSAASSLNVSAVLPTDSAENWGSILTGVLPEKHGLTNSKVDAGIFYDNKNYPTIFKYINEKMPKAKLASISSWKGINIGIIENTVNAFKYSPQINENIFVRLWLYLIHHLCKSPKYDEILVSRLEKYVNEQRDLNLLFIHLTNVDEMGHLFGYNSQEYENQIKILDEHIKKIISIIENLWDSENLKILITTDHGGIENKHGGSTDQETGVFLVISGYNIKPNMKIHGAVTNMDCAAIILDEFDIESPDWFDAKLPIIE